MTSNGDLGSRARRRNLLANLAGRGVSLLATIVFLPLYLDLLGPDAYGLVGIYATLLALMSVADFGLTATINREMARLDVGKAGGKAADALRTVEALFFAIVSLAGGATFLFADGVADRWIEPGALPSSEVANAIRLMSVAAILQLGAMLYGGALAGLQRQVVQNAVAISAGLARGLGAVAVLVWVASSAQAYFLWQVAVNMAFVVAMRAIAWRFVPRGERRPRFDPTVIVRVRSYAAGMFTMSVTSSILLQVDKVFLTRVLPLAHFGYYSIAWTISQMPAAILSLPVRVTFFPRMTQLAEAGQTDELAKVYHLAAETVSLLVVPIVGILVAFPGQVLWVWLGSQDAVAAGAPILQLLAVGGGITAILVIPYAAQLAHGWTTLVVGANLLGVCVYVPAMAYVTSAFGARGAAWLWTVWNLSYLIIVLTIMHRHILGGQAGRWAWEAVGKPVLIVAALLALIGMTFEPARDRVLGLAQLGLTWIACQTLLFAASRRSRGAVAAFLGSTTLSKSRRERTE